MAFLVHVDRPLPDGAQRGIGMVMDHLSHLTSILIRSKEERKPIRANEAINKLAKS